MVLGSEPAISIPGTFALKSYAVEKGDIRVLPPKMMTKITVIITTITNFLYNICHVPSLCFIYLYIAYIIYIYIFL